MKFFRREPSADDALVAVAAERRWASAPASGMSMLPPSHAAADVHDLDSRRPPGCAGRAFATTVGPTQRPATVSHLEIYRNDVEHEIYDVVQWTTEPADAARLELLIGASSWNHHRLGDRFGQGGWRAVKRPDGLKIHFARQLDDAFATAFERHPRLDELMRAAESVRGGVAAEVVGERAAVFTWTVMPHRGLERWATLVAIAETLAAVVSEAGAARCSGHR